MLAYFVITIELAILYTVFWYVFLREPKPYRIKGNAWGAYDGYEEDSKNRGMPKFAMFGGTKSADLTEHGPDCNCNASTNQEKEAKIRSASAIYEEWNTTSAAAPQIPLTAGELIRSQTRGVERITRETELERLALQNADYAPHNPAEQYRDIEQYRSKRKTLPFLTELGDKLNRINVKLP